MNKSTYIHGIVFLSLAVAAGLLQSTLLAIQGFSVAFLQSYANWFLIFGIVYLIAHLFVVRYFYVKGWKFVFGTALASLVIFVGHLALQYYMLINVARELGPVHQLVTMVSLVASVVFGVSLIAQARHDKLLVSLAIFMMAIGITLIGALIFLMQGIISDTVLAVVIWATIIGNALPFFFIAVFLRETKRADSSVSPTSSHVLYNGLGGLAMISLLVLLILGVQLSSESYWQLHWQKHGPVATRKVAERFESRTFVNAKQDTLRYLLLKPLGYDSSKRYPVVTCLHGGPTRIASNIELTQPAPLLSEPGYRAKYPAFLFVPQARPGVLWGGVLNVPSMGPVVLEALDALEAEFSIDKDRSYITGTSGGGYGTWNYICMYPERFAAAMPICGSGDPSLAHKITRVPVWAFHGDVDRNVPVTGSRTMIEAIRSAGGNPKYNEYAGVGHDVWPAVEKTEGVLDWMFAQKRK